MASQTNKMVFASAAKMSLNDRFQMLRQTTQKRAQLSAANARTSAQLRQGSAKNRRLALQMANRPSVRAALRGNNSHNNVKQRLGVQRNALKAAPRFRIARQNFNRNRNVNANANFNAFPNGRQRIRNFRVNNAFASQPQRKGFNKNRFGKLKPRTGPRNMRRAAGGQQTQTRRFKINRNFNASNVRNVRTQGRQRQNFVKKVMPSKQQLDNELDAYMAGSKSFLDAELDAYMSLAS